MTRLGPLTSQALGRSPYDILVLGTGEADPREPPQAYDERGRPYNAETRRINRNIIRAHNEVMQVIGVAEPDSLTTVESEAHNQLIQQIHEDNIGHKLLTPMRMIGVLGIWAVEPLRQRAMLFRRFDDHLPWDNFRQDYGGSVLLRALLVGVPVGLADNYLRVQSLGWHFQDKHRWRWLAAKYVRVHLQAFMLLQRLTLIPGDQLLPSPLFFVPFSGHSPIARPPSLPTELTVGAVATWVAQAILGVAPLVACYCLTQLRDSFMNKIDYAIFDTLDVPSNPPVEREVHRYNPYNGEWRLAGLAPVESLPPRPRVPPPPPPPPPPDPTFVPRGEPPAIPPPPAESQRPFTDTVDNGDSSDTSPRNAIDGHEEAGAGSASSEATPTQDRESTTPTPGSPNTGVRRRNTVSSGVGVDGYNSEEEDFEMSTTLIGFDVEAGSAGDAPPNAWSAELRQTAAVSIGFESNEVYTGDIDDEGLVPGYDAHGIYRGRYPLGTYIRGVYYPDEPSKFYSDTMLSRLPATMFAAGAAAVCSSFMLYELEAATVRLVAKCWRTQQGLPIDDLQGIWTFPFALQGTLSINAANHFAFAIFLEAATQSICTLTALGFAWFFRGSHPKWTFWRVVREKLGFPPKDE